MLVVLLTEYLYLLRATCFINKPSSACGLQLKCDDTRWRTGGEVKGKLANGVGSQYPHSTSEHGVSSITTADAHTLAASSRLNWRPRRFKWTRPFRRKTKSGFCACAITFQLASTNRYSFDTPRPYGRVQNFGKFELLCMPVTLNVYVHGLAMVYV